MIHLLLLCEYILVCLHFLGATWHAYVIGILTWDLWVFVQNQHPSFCFCWQKYKIIIFLGKEKHFELKIENILVYNVSSRAQIVEEISENLANFSLLPDRFSLFTCFVWFKHSRGELLWNFQLFNSSRIRWLKNCKDSYKTALNESDEPWGLASQAVAYFAYKFDQTLTLRE